MKTLIASVLLTASLAFAASSNASAQTNEEQFSVVSIVNGKIDVNVVKSEQTAYLNLVDESGRTLATKEIPKDASATRTRFDMNQLPDGNYKVILIEGKTKQVKQVELNTHQVETQRIVSLG